MKIRTKQIPLKTETGRINFQESDKVVGLKILNLSGAGICMFRFDSPVRDNTSIGDGITTSSALLRELILQPLTMPHTIYTGAIYWAYLASALPASYDAHLIITQIVDE